jgi:UDP-hydrolysing UDP-N-acetyl-D-glucosamine 2-epimerase
VRTIDVVTTSRADYGILLPVLRCMQSDRRLRLRVIVSGSHLSPLFGMTVMSIEADGFEIADRIDVLGSSDSAEATADAMGRGLSGFGRHFARSRPDVLVVLGDRFEMHSAAAAALPFRLPVAHIHGGEVTTGAFDDALRQSITKLSHLHFVTTEGARRRVLRLGEEAWRVTISGAPSLDNLRRVRLRTRQEVEVETGLRVPEQFALVTFHPATLEESDPAAQMGTLLDTLENGAIQAIVTMPNADPGGRAVRAVIEARAQSTSAVQPVENLGTDLYFSLMAHATAMVGNSSSGIIEAASFALPVVNIGSRQNGRERTGNVIDVAASGEAIAAGLRRALLPSFKASLAGMSNPYGDGHAAERIVERLSGIDLTPALIQKQPSDAEPA